MLILCCCVCFCLPLAMCICMLSSQKQINRFSGSYKLYHRVTDVPVYKTKVVSHWKVGLWVKFLWVMFLNYLTCCKWAEDAYRLKHSPELFIGYRILQGLIVSKFSVLAYSTLRKNAFLNCETMSNTSNLHLPIIQALNINSIMFQYGNEFYNSYRNIDIHINIK